MRDVAHHAASPPWQATCNSVSVMSSRTTRLARLPLYLGGMMGPFGTIVIIPMFPELRETFSASSAAVSWGFTIYMLPFAAALLVSGTLGERWGRRRSVRSAFLLFAVASLVCALAPNLAVFLVGRALQGVANAFITPLLVAGLAEVVEPAAFGRSVGIYSSFQAAGGGLAPVVGGLAADVNWRWAFVGVAMMATLLATAPPPGEPRLDAAPPEFRQLLTRRMLIFGGGVFFAAAGPIGIAVLVGVAARDELGLSGGEAGLLLLCGPLAAMITGPFWGRLLDNWGPRRGSLVATAAATTVGALLALGTTPISLALISAASGALIGFVVVVVQSLASTVVDGNRGGALSFVLAFRFLGHGIGPVIWIPLLGVSAPGALIGAASLGIITFAAFWIVTKPSNTAVHSPA
jgi:MFS family permease